MVNNYVMVELGLYIWIRLPQVNNNTAFEIHFAEEGNIKNFSYP